MPFASSNNIQQDQFCKAQVRLYGPKFFQVPLQERSEEDSPHNEKSQKGILQREGLYQRRIFNLQGKVCRGLVQKATTDYSRFDRV